MNKIFYFTFLSANAIIYFIVLPYFLAVLSFFGANMIFLFTYEVLDPKPKEKILALAETFAYFVLVNVFTPFMLCVLDICANGD